MTYNKRKAAGTAVILIIALFLSILFKFTIFASEGDSGNNQISSDKVQLTDEEKKYLKNNPTIVMATDASWRPLEYVKDDRYSGVIAEILDKLCEYTGFKIEYKMMGSYSDALEAIQSGDADMISGLADDRSMADEYNVNLTEPFLTINSAVISKGDVSSLYESSSHKKIAVVVGDYENAEIERRIPNVSLVECESNEECLQKIQSDDVDMAIIASYCAEYYMSVPKYSAYKTHTMSDFSWQLSFGINKNVDPVMLSILDKGIKHMSQVDMNESIYKGLIDAEYDNDLMMFVYKHPIMVISAVLIIVFIVGTLIFSILILRKKEHRRQIEDGTRLRLALERTHLCIWEYDIVSQSIKQIDNEHEKHGFYELRENIPDSMIENGYIHPDDVQFAKVALERVKKGEQNVQGCWRVKEKISDSKTVFYWWENVVFHVVYDDHHKPIKAIGVSEDVTKEKEAQRDSLTQVFNRNSFEQKAGRSLNERGNAYTECAYIILDLDGFKKINDTYGHGMGDKVLVSVGATLTKTFRSTDIVGRLGGDEFTVFMTSISKKEDAMRKAEELVKNISAIQEKDNYEFPIHCSVGVVVATKGKEELTTMYKKADTALYEAKRSGKNQYRIYEESK